MTLSLLDDALLTTDTTTTLPGLLAAMARGEVTGFPALRPHQRAAWHMFLVQLAVVACQGSERTDLPTSEDDWRPTLLALTDNDEAPWHLLADSSEAPAFLQPSDPGGLRWSKVETPDALDMLITSRNHDLKRQIALGAGPEEWIYALVSLQTMEGFGGAGNYGIAKMNGGSSSRVMLTLAPAHGFGPAIDLSAWWRRDVTHLLATTVPDPRPALLWLLPWPEGRSLGLENLHPLFIEVCRRVRLVGGPEGLHALRSTSKAARVAGKDAKGVTGDPWAPVHLSDAKSLTLSDRDWTYRLLCELLYGGSWMLPDLAVPLEPDRGRAMVLLAEAFARGNSKTDGFKSRAIPVPEVIDRLAFVERPVALARAMIESISDFDRILRDALAIVAARGSRDKPGAEDYAASRPARVAFDRHADALFFPALWDLAAEISPDARLPRFRRFYRDLAACVRAEFENAAPFLAGKDLMAPRALSRGRARLDSGLRRYFEQTIQVEEKANG